MLIGSSMLTSGVFQKDEKLLYQIAKLLLIWIDIYSIYYFIRDLTTGSQFSKQAKSVHQFSKFFKFIFLFHIVQSIISTKRILIISCQDSSNEPGTNLGKYNQKFYFYNFK